MNKKALIFSLLAIFLFTGVVCGMKIGYTKKVSIKKLGDYYPVAISPDQGRAAVLDVANLALKVHLLVDGKAGKTYDGIDTSMVTFSPDSQSFAYYARKNKRWLLVIGDEEVKICNGAQGRPLFSNDGKRCAAILEDEGEWMVFARGEDSNRSYLHIKDLQFSPDSSKMGYLAQRPDEKWVAVINQTESLPYDSIKWLVFSPDSRHIAFSASKDEKEFVVIDGKEGNQYNKISDSNYGFSPDGQDFAYFAHSGQKWILVKNGEEMAEYENIISNSLKYKEKLFFMASTETKSMLVIDGKPEKPYDRIGFIRTNSTANRIIYSAMENGQWFRVENGIEGKKYDQVSDPVFSENGEHFAYKAQVGQRRLMVIDDIEHPAYDDVSNLIFSSDGTQTAYIGTLGKKRFVVRNGQAENSYKGINKKTLCFSTDGKYLVYEANDTLIINNKKSGYFGDIVSKIAFDDLNKLYFIGVTKSSIYNPYTHIYMEFTYCNRYDLELE
ncbi:MAG: hypothetical protein ACM3X9_12460 [Bacillota bacterium]